MKTLRTLGWLVLVAGLIACGSDSKSVTGPEGNNSANEVKDDGSQAPDRVDGEDGPDGVTIDPSLVDPGFVVDPEVLSTADLIQRLEAGGVAVELTDERVQQPFFTPDARILKIGAESVQVFDYETVEALKSEARQVAPDGASIGTTMVSWMGPPRFYATGTVIVLYVGFDETVMRALDSILGGAFAGAEISLPPDDLPVFDPEIASVADLIGRLESLGLEVAATEEVAELEFLTPVGQVIYIDGEKLFIFAYDSVEQLKQEASAVPQIQTFAATTPTRYFAVANFIVAYTGENLSILTALDRILGGPFVGSGLEPNTIAPGEPYPVPPPAGVEGTIPELQNASMMVATTASDLRSMVSLLQDPALSERLADIDLSQSVVIAIFRGAMPTAGYGVEIEEVRTFDSYVEVTVSFTDPGHDALVAQVITYPVAVRIVPRTDVPEVATVNWIAVTPEGEGFAKFSAGAGNSGSASVDGTPTPDPVVGTITVDPTDVDAQDDLSIPQDEEPMPPITLRDADIRGAIASYEAVDGGSGILAQILVAGEIEADTGFDQALVRITEETRVVRISANDAYTEATCQDLVPGTRVQVLFTGPIMESYPVQVAALHVVILQ